MSPLQFLVRVIKDASDFDYVWTYVLRVVHRDNDHWKWVE